MRRVCVPLSAREEICVLGDRAEGPDDWVQARCLHHSSQAECLSYFMPRYFWK